ncbi:MAG: family 16 glycoside hydrolase, partial [Opitutus sp.]
MKITRLVLCLASLTAAVATFAAEEWESLFDGKTLAGWKAAEHPASFTVTDGTIRGSGARAHLFYLGGDGKAEFENFELELEFKAVNRANS